MADFIQEGIIAASLLTHVLENYFVIILISFFTYSEWMRFEFSVCYTNPVSSLSFKFTEIQAVVIFEISVFTAVFRELRRLPGNFTACCMDEFELAVR